MKQRQSNNPKRRILAPEGLSREARSGLLKRARYVGAAYHKRSPADYPFRPQADPRPRKSVCDDLRVVGFAEARLLFTEGVRRAMVSEAIVDDLPKYVWAVDELGEAYEAKIGSGADYHGYRLSEANEGAMRAIVLAAWSERHEP